MAVNGGLYRGNPAGGNIALESGSGAYMDVHNAVIFGSVKTVRKLTGCEIDLGGGQITSAPSATDECIIRGNQIQGGLATATTDYTIELTTTGSSANHVVVIEGNTIRLNQSGDPARNHQFATGGAIALYSISTASTPVVSRNLIEEK